jgi:hypothetical protein
VLLFQTFQNGAGGWTHAPLAGGSDSWILSEERCDGADLGSLMFVSNGNYGATCVEDSATERSKLVGPSVGVPDNRTVILSFDALSYDEAGRCLANPDGDYDLKEVGLSTDGGATWTPLGDCPALADGSGNLIHHEFDISAFHGQNVRVVFAYDTVDSEFKDTFAVDNVRIASAPLNADGDPLPDACDCVERDPLIWAVPPEIPGSIGFQGPITLAWPGVGGPNPTYDVLRGSLRQLPFASAPKTCLASKTAATALDDAAVPAPGQGYFYLIRGRNVCGPGTYGFGPTGEYLSNVCP